MSEKRKINWWLVWLVIVIVGISVEGYYKDLPKSSLDLKIPFPQKIVSDLTTNCRVEFRNIESLKKCTSNVEFYSSTKANKIIERYEPGAFIIDPEKLEILSAPIGDMARSEKTEKVNNTKTLEKLISLKDLKEVLSQKEYALLKEELNKTYSVSGFLELMIGTFANVYLEPGFYNKEFNKKGNYILTSSFKFKDEMEGIRSFCEFPITRETFSRMPRSHPCFGKFLLKFNTFNLEEKVKLRPEIVGFQLNFDNITNWKNNILKIERSKAEEKFINHRIDDCHNKFFEFHHNNHQEKNLQLQSDNIFIFQCADDLIAASSLLKADNIGRVDLNELSKLKPAIIEKVAAEFDCYGGFKQVGYEFSAHVTGFTNDYQQSVVLEVLNDPDKITVHSLKGDDQIELHYVLQCLDA